MKKESKIVTMQIFWKNSDAPEALRKWGDYGEYFSATCKVNVKTGRGTIQMSESQVSQPPEFRPEAKPNTMKTCKVSKRPGKCKIIMWHCVDNFPSIAICSCGAKWKSRMEWDLIKPKAEISA